MSGYRIAQLPWLLDSNGRPVGVKLQDGTEVLLPTFPNNPADGSSSTSGIVDPFTGNTILLGGGSAAPPQLKRLLLVSITFPDLTVDQTSGFPPRLVMAERNRRRLVFKNPATNTVSFQFGSRQADNIQNPNYNFTPSYTIAPGQELVCLFDEAQWWGRQANTAAVAGQALTIEREVLV